ncbi:MAG: ABC transporter ATP-binding protein [Candidatus Bathyarchaeia archaeon]
MVLLKVCDITKRFGGIIALNKVSVDLIKGEILGLIGPNGSGKTTLVNVISGLYLPDSGKIIYKNVDITRIPAYLRCRIGIARTYQILRLFNNLTVFENVLIGVLNGRKYGKISMGNAESEAENILKILGLYQLRDLQAKSLNVHEKRRLELARALAGDPELLILDECLAGLPPSEIFRMLDLIKKIREERDMTIIMIEHLMHAVMNISNRVVVLHEGRKIAEGEPAEVSKDVKVAEVYFGDRELALRFVKR